VRDQSEKRFCIQVCKCKVVVWRYSIMQQDASGLFLLFSCQVITTESIIGGHHQQSTQLSNTVMTLHDTSIQPVLRHLYIADGPIPMFPSQLYPTGGTLPTAPYRLRLNNCTQPTAPSRLHPNNCHVPGCP
jgi:hypothetical protein